MKQAAVSDGLVGRMFRLSHVIPGHGREVD